MERHSGCSSACSRILEGGFDFKCNSIQRSEATALHIPDVFVWVGGGGGGGEVGGRGSDQGLRFIGFRV